MCVHTYTYAIFCGLWKALAYATHIKFRRKYLGKKLRKGFLESANWIRLVDSMSDLVEESLILRVRFWRKMSQMSKMCYINYLCHFYCISSLLPQNYQISFFHFIFLQTAFISLSLSLSLILFSSLLFSFPCLSFAFLFSQSYFLFLFSKMKYFLFTMCSLTLLFLSIYSSFLCLFPFS